MKKREPRGKREEKPRKRGVVRTLVRSIREYTVYAVLNPIMMILEVACEVALPFVMKILVDNIKTGDLANLAIFSAVLIGLACLSLTFGYFGGKLAAIASTGFAKNIRKDLFAKIQNFSFANIDRFSASSLVTRMTTDVAYIQMAFQMLIRITFRVPIMMALAIVMSFTINVAISWIFIAVLPILAVVLGFVAYYGFRIFRRVFRKYDSLNESVLENVRGIRVVKDYVREDYERKKFAAASDALAKDFTKAERIAAIVSPTMNFCMYLVSIVVAFLGAYIIVKTHEGAPGIEWILPNGYNMGVLTTGDIQAILAYGIMILSSLMMLAMIMVMLSMSSASAKRIAEVMNEEPTIKNPKDPVYTVKDGSILFKNVCFKYDLHADKFALKGINLDIKSGMTVGIIGGTGSSKSTLVNLISRLYDVTCGRVMVGGVDVRDYDLETLRKNVAAVLQDSILFSGTINDNLRWGNENATQEQIIAAARMAQADEFIQGFPDKYETKITQGGTNVSGGQKQRLCIARALLRRPKIIIMDDSTSAVDTKTDAQIRKSFADSIPGTTKIIIAQRVKSIEDSDLIIVMDNGEINGMGTNDELMRTNEIYREIVAIQSNIGGRADG